MKKILTLILFTILSIQNSSAGVSICGDTIYTSGPNYSQGKSVKDIFERGEAYYNQKDYVNAAKYYLEAAELGYPPAQNELGWLYFLGRGVKMNFLLAEKWFLKAAEKRIVSALFGLGSLYQHCDGGGFKKDFDKALFWYKKAADQGDTESLCAIGSLYLEKNWSKKSDKLAFCYYMKAAEKGNIGALNRVGTFYYDGIGTKKDYQKAYYWYKKAADQDNENGQFNLGLFYSTGAGTSIDYEKANQWFAKYVKNNSHNARLIGYLYEEGFVDVIDLPTNIDQALYWYKKAEEYGDKEARKDIQRLLEKKEFAQKSAKNEETTNPLPKSEQKRIALIIGNGDYTSGRLPNPVNDSKALHKKLLSIGFETTSVTNLNKVGMEDKIEEFAEKAKGFDVALFYYAGHAVQLNGVNYLLPVGERLNNDAAIRTNCPTLDLVIQNLIDAGVKNSIIILDACRDNPNMQKIASRRGYGAKGLASIKELQSGFLIAYSTQPNEEAEDGSDTGEKNSPFTAALLDALDKPMKTIDEIFIEVRSQVKKKTNDKQIPVYSNNLRDLDLRLNINQ